MRTKNYHHGDLKNALIKAGVELLSKDGAEGLSLRKVAQRAGVSHNAPYAHFSDKQSLIAAISTEGFKQLYDELDAIVTTYKEDPKRQLQEGAWTYAQFAIKNPEPFKIMFSSALEKEKEYPAFVEISHKTFQRVVDVVRACQEAGILRSAPSELLAVSIWGQIHGIVSLLLEGQLSHTVLDQYQIREIIYFSLDQLLVPNTAS